MSFSPLSTLALTLTVDNILKAVHGVAWWKLGEELLHSDKLYEIVQQHQSDDSTLRAVMECWLQGDGRDEEPSWRALIRRLDRATETKAADTIRHFAEPLPGR